jgi:hypothetical protein
MLTRLLFACSFISLFALVEGCAPLLTLAGSSGSAVQLAAQLDRVKLVADGMSYVASHKTLSEHALSLAAGADCSIINVVSGNSVCVYKNGGANDSASGQISVATGSVRLSGAAPVAIPTSLTSSTEPTVH